MPKKVLGTLDRLLARLTRVQALALAVCGVGFVGICD